jgi:hypothetical protein
MFWDQLSPDQWEAARSTAVMLGLQLFGIELNGSPYDYEAALRKAPLDHRGLTKRRSSLVMIVLLTDAVAREARAFQ